jgi:hypothetical protein
MGVKLTTHLHLVLRSRMCGAAPPLLQYIFTVWCLVKHRNIFTLYHFVESHCEIHLVCLHLLLCSLFVLSLFWLVCHWFTVLFLLYLNIFPIYATRNYFKWMLILFCIRPLCNRKDGTSNDTFFTTDRTNKPLFYTFEDLELLNEIN